MTKSEGQIINLFLVVVIIFQIICGEVEIEYIDFKNNTRWESGFSDEQKQWFWEIFKVIN